MSARAFGSVPPIPPVPVVTGVPNNVVKMSCGSSRGGIGALSEK